MCQVFFLKKHRFLPLFIGLHPPKRLTDRKKPLDFGLFLLYIIAHEQFYIGFYAYLTGYNIRKNITRVKLFFPKWGFFLFRVAEIDDMSTCHRQERARI